MGFLFLDDTVLLEHHHEAPQGPPCNCEAHRSIDRCDHHAAFGFEKRDPWEKSDVTREGTVAFGRKNDGCTDLGGHFHRLLDCRGEGASKCGEAQARYFLVEFARDVELQTKESRYT